MSTHESLSTPQTAAHQANPLLAAWTLCQRELVRFIRQRNRVFGALGQPIIFWLLFSEGLGFAIPVAYLKHFLDNRDAFAFDKTNPNTGYRYLEAPRRRNPDKPPEKAAEALTQAGTQE